MPASMSAPKTPGTCRWCALAILSKTGKPVMVTWHKECVTEYMVACFSKPQRQAVKKRDHGACCGCGVDTARIRARIFKVFPWWKEAAEKKWGARWKAALQKRIEAYRLAGWPVGERKEGKWWQADHRMPLIEANGRIEYFRLDNLQTLCCKCHAVKTKAEQQARAALKRQQAAASLASPGAEG